ncbi:hypothetical protein NH287_05130 [Microbacterium sp. CnD16-F]|nr:hypothetical protein [Microbacterium sp. CnD16-F]MCO7202885.1 hypothetical protein [Microbacterium sp. CnD16-F]
MTVSADRFLLGVTGVHEDAGLTTGDADEAAMKRTLASRAAEPFVLGTAEKIGAASRYRLLTWDAVDGVIVDAEDAAGATTLSALKRRDVSVLR